MRKHISIAILLLASSCGWIETTQTQRNYVSDRDECREYAEQKVLSQRASPEQQKDRLVREFANCMKPRGWSVSGPDDKEKEKPRTEVDPPIDIAVSRTPAPVVIMQDEDFMTPREAQCSYARHAKKNSTIAKEMAKDCDEQCKDFPSSDACPRKRKKY